MPKLGAPCPLLAMPMSFNYLSEPSAVTEMYDIVFLKREIFERFLYTCDSKFASMADLAEALARSSWLWSTVMRTK